MRLKKPVEWLKQGLGQQPRLVITIFAACTTFSVYTCMYGYRKAFTAATFSEETFLGIDFKIWLVSAQVFGYMLSKFYGIRFIAENDRRHRSATILKLILLAWLSLLAFAIVPAPWSIIFLFANGFPLGMIWGLVFSYVEGRRATEMMGAVLASSFIFASGFAKTIGSWLVKDMQVPENWMPFVAGAIYLVPLLVFTFLLEAIPDPDEQDIAQRSVRMPMNHEQRKNFLFHLGPGLLPVIATYVILTILRDFRDNFAAEIMNEIGLGSQAAIFSQTEIPVALLVLAAISLLALFRNNFHAFYFNHVLILVGLGTAAASTILFSLGLMSPFYWFMLVGFGLYLGYIPINCMYFDRMIACFQLTANVGFIMYVADSFGYLGSVSVLLMKEFVGLQLSWLQFFQYCIYASTIIGITCVLYALYYFKRKFYQTVFTVS